MTPNKAKKGARDHAMLIGAFCKWRTVKTRSAFQMIVQCRNGPSEVLRTLGSPLPAAEPPVFVAAITRPGDDPLPPMHANFSDVQECKDGTRLIIELPIEAMSRAFDAFGEPTQSKHPPVVVAAANKDAQPQTDSKPDACEGEERHGSLAKDAAITCEQKAFQKWCGVDDAEGAAASVRHWCDVDSRADLDHDAAAAEKWLRMKSKFSAWFLGLTKKGKRK